MKLKKKVPLLVVLGSVLAITSYIGSNIGNPNDVKKLGAQKIAENGNTYYSMFTNKEDMLKAGDELAEEVAGEGMVLLKNDGKLPWDGVKYISIFGKNSVDPGYTGGGSGGAKGQRTPVSIYDALQEKGYKTNPALEAFYNDENRSGIARQTLNDIFAGPIDIGETDADLYDDALKGTFKGYNDAAVVVITRVGSEGSDNGTAGVVDHEKETSANGPKNTYKDQKAVLRTYNELSQNELDMIEMVKANFKNIVVVVNTPSAMELGDLENDPQINGIIWAGLPGYTGFRALAGILDGSVNPSGGLADTFYASMKADPTFQNFGNGTQHEVTLNADGTATYKDHSGILKADGKEYVSANANQNQGSAGGNGAIQATDSGNQGGQQGGNDSQDQNQGGANQGPGGFGRIKTVDPTLRSNSSTSGGTSANAESVVEYEEGIYVGYRYYETRGYAEDGVNGTVYSEATAGSKYAKDATSWYDKNVVYPFGYGLSYTTFDVSVENPKAADATINDNETLTFKVTVKNTGNTAGKHIVQLYYEAPYTAGGIEKSSKVLGGYTKTDMIQPGQSQTVEVSIDVQKMASYDWNDANDDGHKGYELDTGDYKFYVSRNAHEYDSVVSYKVTDTSKVNGQLGSKNKSIDFDNDGYTTNKVENRLTGRYASIPEEGNDLEDLGFTQMTRANFQASFPAFPTDEERTDTKGKIEKRLHHVFYLYELEEDTSKSTIDNVGTGINDVRHKTIDDLKDKAGTRFTQATDTTGKVTYQLKDMAGVDKDDPKWTTLLNELTYTELLTLVLDGSSGTGTNSRIGKNGTSDTDGPTAIAQINYPAPVQQAATFNTDLINRVGTMVGEEALWSGHNGWRGPGLNIHRSPFNGRNFEYYSEDGYLAGTIAAASVSGANSKGFVTWAKHLGTNEQETARSGGVTILTEQTLREIYLKPFQLATEIGHSDAYMTAMSRIGLVQTYMNKAVLQNIVKDEWGFDGVLITDALNGGNPVSAIANKAEMATAGQDVIMDNAPSANHMKVYGEWDATKQLPVFTFEDDDFDDYYGVHHNKGDQVDLVSGYYWLRVSALNMLYTEANSNLVKNGYDLSAYTAKTIKTVVGQTPADTVAAEFAQDAKKPAYVSYEVASGTLPAGLTLNADGSFKGAASEAGTYTVTVNLKADYWIQTSARITIEVEGVLKYEGTDLSNVASGATISGKFSHRLNEADYTSVAIELAKGSQLPEGITLDAQGNLAGKAADGTYTFTVNVVTKVTENTGGSSNNTKTNEYPTVVTLVVGEQKAVTPEYEANVPYIGANGNWFVNGKDLGVKAQGEKGDTGATGETGPKGDTGAAGADGSGCGGSIVATTTLAGALALAGAAVVLKKKKED